VDKKGIVKVSAVNIGINAPGEVYQRTVLPPAPVVAVNVIAPGPQR
jgi:hypothetical protein